MHNGKGWRSVFRRVNRLLTEYSARGPLDCTRDAPERLAEEVRAQLEHLFTLTALSKDKRLERVLDHLSTIIDCGAEPRPVVEVAREIDRRLRQRFNLPPRQEISHLAPEAGEEVIEFSVEGIP